jgi:alpha-1,3-rhamnosyl/mannosyltransferase
MRVALLLLAAGRKAGGPETYEVELLRHMAHLDRETQFFAYTTEDAEDAIAVRRTNVHYRRLKPKNRWLSLSFGIHRQMREDKIDMLHCTYAPPPFASDYIFTMHCVSNLYFPEYYGRFKALRLNLLQLLGMSRAREILCVSIFVQDELAKTYKVSRRRMSVVYNGVDKVFQPFRVKGLQCLLKQRFDISKPYILYVGKLQSRKNLVRLIEAYNRFRDRCAASGSQPLQLVLAGRRTDEDTAIGDAMHESPYTSDILEVGYVGSPSVEPGSDLPALYRGARMFVFPSLFEGFGFPPVEAMACGVPVLCSNTTSLPEVVGDAALLVDPLSADAIAGGMQRLHTDEDLRSALIERGFERARQFTWERCATETLAAYRRALAK